ncbi:hypothetical protein CQA38_03035 [Campylobacter sp. MIT 12-5580]|uniref:hypothetical protein n=1 Tax=Campylobacter sp. MIT 12-5580 TaxID=2040651 RepID=UPI0010F83A0E|nr:hypothetical protein [Campylobacter sp. MIT 12-5580]TKX29763.1 hypothetical protein CQA38_03035 [Campylobacter sp. MIT 12-5580]
MNVYLHSYKSLNFHDTKTKEQGSNFKDFIKQEIDHSSSLKIISPKETKQFDIINGHKANITWKKSSNPIFSNALSAPQAKVSNLEYQQALNDIKKLMQELSSLAIEEQGLDSELGFNLEAMFDSFDSITQFLAKEPKSNTPKEYKIENVFSDEIAAMKGSLDLSSSIPFYALSFFDYASDKFQGLDTQKIMQDLATIKGYWDNNTASDLSLGNDIQEEASQASTNISNQSFALKENFSLLENKSFNILLNMFENNINSKIQPEQSALQRALKELG